MVFICWFFNELDFETLTSEVRERDIEKQVCQWPFFAIQRECLSDHTRSFRPFAGSSELTVRRAICSLLITRENFGFSGCTTARTPCTIRPSSGIPRG